jgi:ubiquinone/menaquinone biosynthesis C-methylase UbiE
MTTAAGARPLYDSLAAVYDRWLSGDEAAGECQDFYRTQMRHERGSVLELGCGTGRICRALAADGVRVTGLDLSMAMLRGASTSSAQLVRGDVTQLPFADGAFAAVLLPMRTVGHLTGDDQVDAAFTEAARVLQPGGRFLLDHYQLDPDWARAHDGVFRLMYAGAAPGAEDRAVLIWDRYDYDYASHTLHCTVQLDEVGPAASGAQAEQVHFDFRWFEADELERFAHRAGLRAGFCWGDFAGAPFGPRSEHMVFRFDKPQEAR